MESELRSFVFMVIYCPDMVEGEKLEGGFGGDYADAFVTARKECSLDCAFVELGHTMLVQMLFVVPLFVGLHSNFLRGLELGLEEVRLSVTSL